MSTGQPMASERNRLTEDIIQLLRTIGQSMYRHMSPEAWMDLGLTIVQLKSLFFIAFEGSTNFKKLADALNVTPPSVTGIIDRLVERGLVTRQENPENRRMQTLKVTEKGSVLIFKLRDAQSSQLSGLLSGLSIDDLVKVHQGLDLLAGAAAGQHLKNSSEN
jgi:DNA-binding MarR family transcriptional regulator